MASQHWEMLRWITGYIQDNQEKWEKKKLEDEKKINKDLEEWEKMKRFEKISKLRKKWTLEKNLNLQENPEKEKQVSLEKNETWEVWRKTDSSSKNIGSDTKEKNLEKINDEPPVQQNITVENLIKPPSLEYQEKVSISEQNDKNDLAHPPPPPPKKRIRFEHPVQPLPTRKPSTVQSTQNEERHIKESKKREESRSSSEQLNRSKKLAGLKPPLKNEKIVKNRSSKKINMNEEKSQSNNITNYFKSENMSNSSITSAITETTKKRQNVTQKDVPKNKSQSNNITKYFKPENTSNSSITSVITGTQKNRQNVTQMEVPNIMPILSSKDADMKGGDSDVSDNLSINANNKVVLAPARITTDVHITQNSNQSQNSVSCAVSDLTEINKTFTSKHLGGQNDSNPGKT